MSRIMFIVLFVVLTLGFGVLKIQQLRKFQSEKALFFQDITSQNYPINEPKTITFVAGGDVMLGRYVNHKIQEKGIYYPFENVGDVFKKADLAFVNLENPLVDPCPVIKTGMIFCAPTSSVESLTLAGIDVVNLANNHSSNYGNTGYNSTKDILKYSDILSFDSSSAAYFTIKGTKLGFIGFDLTSKIPKTDIITAKIAEVVAISDFTIVSFHWGNEYETVQNRIQETYGRLAVDNGADLVLGHHPHVVQPIERYKEALIIYSMGNLIFDQMWSEETRSGLVVKVYIQSNKISRYETLPVKIYDYSQPQFEGEQKMFIVGG